MKAYKEKALPHCPDCGVQLFKTPWNKFWCYHCGIIDDEEDEEDELEEELWNL